MYKEWKNLSHTGHWYRSGGLLFSLCLGTLKVIRARLGGFVLCLLKHELRHHFQDAAFVIKRQDSHIRMRLPGSVTLSSPLLLFDSKYPSLDRVGIISIHRRTHEITDL